MVNLLLLLLGKSSPVLVHANRQLGVVVSSHTSIVEVRRAQNDSLVVDDQQFGVDVDYFRDRLAVHQTMVSASEYFQVVFPGLLRLPQDQVIDNLLDHAVVRAEYGFEVPLNLNSQQVSVLLRDVSPESRQ